MNEEEKRLLERVRGMYGSTGKSPRGTFILFYFILPPPRPTQYPPAALAPGPRTSRIRRSCTATRWRQPARPDRPTCNSSTHMARHRTMHPPECCVLPTTHSPAPPPPPFPGPLLRPPAPPCHFLARVPSRPQPAGSTEQPGRRMGDGGRGGRYCARQRVAPQQARRRRVRAAALTSFCTSSHACLNSTPPPTRRVLCSTSCPCSSWR